MANAPTLAELAADPSVLLALEAAWVDSLAGDALSRHEEGGWIYADVLTAALAIRRAAPGGRSLIDLDSPPTLPGCVVVATFHTHPNPKADGWETGPSRGDISSAHFLGVPCIIRAEDGMHTTGPDSRRGGLTGPPGYP